MLQKPDLVRLVAGTAGLDSEAAEKAVDAVLDGIAALPTMDADEMLILRGFGTFRIVHRKASITRNPRTGEKMDVPASKRLSFKASKGGRA